MSNLSRYNQSTTDRHTAAPDESLLGHLVEEQGWTVKEALENLAPIAKHTYAQTVSVASSSKWLAVAGGVIGLIGGGTVGLMGALPIGAAALAFLAYREANQCIPRREIELRALKQCPTMLDLMYGCHLKGIEAKNLIAAWDIFLDTYEESGGADANLMAREYLRILDGLCFTIGGEGAPMPQSLPEPAKYQPGPNTQLSAISVPAQSAQAEDIARSLAEHLQSTLIVGQPGAGKGLTIAYATRWIKKLHPECQIWAIDPKSDPSEADYWTVCDRVLNCPIRPFTPAEDMEAIQAQIDAFIAEFQGSYAPMKLLIFDEALAVKEKTGKWFKGLMAGFNALCSMGRSSKQYGWLVSQSPNTDDFGISGGTRNVYRRVLLLARSNLGLIANGSTFFAGKPTTEQLMQTGRVYFDSITNEWGVTPVYPDLVKQSAPHSRRQSLEALIQTEAKHPIEHFYHASVEPEASTSIDDGELAIKAEIKRFLLANPEGVKPRDLSARGRKPVKGMSTDDIKLYLDVMALDSEIYEVDGSFFVNS
ncbi:hypothetical protein H6F89_00095 [Cyanobacteria bacterium FACHB-63]|nr:hypothetical protein [Cyanobacteria bacterium FACHB-63]